MGYPLGAENDPRAPWNESEIKTRQLIEDFDVWVDDETQESFKFDVEVYEYEDGDAVGVKVLHCYGKKPLPDTYQDDLNEELRAQYGQEVQIEYDL